MPYILRIFCRGVPKIGGVEYPITPAMRFENLEEYLRS